jgi:DNA repair exonuclease SbcCD ATPase subunit
MSDTSHTITDTGQGFLQGVEPAQPRMAADWGQGTAAQQVAQQQPLVQPQEEQRPAYRWTDEDIANARREEKDKLYPTIQQLQDQMKTFQEREQERQAELERQAQEAEEARRAKEESEMDLRQLLERRDQEHREALEAIQKRYEADRAVFEREQELAAVENYRIARLDQERENILPELRKFVQGSTPEEIDASIEQLKADTMSVFQNLAEAEGRMTPAPFQQQRGAAPTAPPIGPLEQQQQYQSLTPEDIRTMDMETYKRHREGLLRASNPNFRG